MRIAYLSPSGQLGGAEVCLLDMVAVVRQARPDWKVSIILGEDGPLSARLGAMGTEVAVLPFPPDVAQLGDSAGGGRTVLALKMLRTAPAAMSYRRQLSSALAALAPDIIHSNGFKMHLLGAMAKKEPWKLIWHIHDYVSTRRMMAHLLRRYEGRVDVIIANSRSVADDIARVVGPGRIVPILNVVDQTEFSPDGPVLDLDGKCGLPPAPPGIVRVGLIATMAWWKGHRLFLEAIAKLDRNLPVRAYVVGGSVYQTGSRQESVEALRRYAADLGIADRVGFTGFVAEPASAMRALDVVVHASTEPEPFGRVIVEAAACGKPVISSGKGGAEEILALGDFGLTFDSGKADSLAGAIKRLVNAPAERERMARNGLATVRSHFGRERLAQTLPKLYEESSR